MTESINFYNKAIALDPSYAEAYNNLGTVLYEKEDHKKALKAYNKAIKIYPKYAEAYYNQALLYKKMRKYNKSIESFHNALKIKPDYFDAHFDLGQVYTTVGKFNESIADNEILICFLVSAKKLLTGCWIKIKKGSFRISKFK